jgi:ADP-heptose:LPS heptosyltransferase
MSTRLKKIVNPYKKRFFKFLTSSFRNSSDIFELSKVDKGKIRRVLVTRPNHRLGNQLLISPLIQALEKEFPNCKIDLLVNGTLSNIIFENYKNIGEIYPLPKKPFKNLSEYIRTSYRVITKKYDIAIVGIESSNSSRIFVRLSKSRYKIFNSENKSRPPVHIAQIPVDSLMYILNKGKGIENYPKLELKLTKAEIDKGQEIISDTIENNKPIVAIFTNATGRKKLSKQWWQSLCREIEIQLPDVNIFEILPKENTSQVDFAYKNFLSHDIREMAAIIESCSVFIGADSGVMHLATATNTPTFGLFNGISNADVYGPYGKDKFTINTNDIEVKTLVEKVKNTLLKD